jgi:acetylornithine deacetylase/succinyl-diaminopimelate desuccinylase-like protein
VVRPLVRVLFLKRVLRRGHFGRPAKTLEPLEPAASPASPDVLTARLQAAATAFKEDMETASRSGQATLDHPFFGRVHLDDYVRFQLIHTHHHHAQLER